MIHRDPRLGDLTPYSAGDPGIGGSQSTDSTGLNWTVVAIAAAALVVLKIIGIK